MKLQILQENLSQALLTTSRFANSKAQLPVLGNVLLSTKGSKLQIASTNLEVSLSLKLAAKIEEEGEITIPAKTITEIVSNLTPGTLEFASSKEQIEISKETFHSRLSGMNAADFPSVLNELPKEGLFEIPVKELSVCFSKVAFASATDETRPILTGVLLIFSNNTLTMVATDGFRLSQKKVKQAVKSKDIKIVVPKNSLSEAIKIFEKENVFNLSYQENQNQVVFGVGESVLASRIIDGNFPDYEKIIPKEPTIKVNVDKEDLLRAVKLSAVLARESANIVKFKVSKDGLSVRADSSTSGEGETLISAKVDGDAKDFGIAFNFRFLEEFIHSCTSTDVQMEFVNGDSAGIFKDSSDVDYLHLIMPVKLQN